MDYESNCLWANFYIDPVNIKVCKQVGVWKRFQIKYFFQQRRRIFYKAPFVIVVIENISRIFDTNYVQ